MSLIKNGFLVFTLMTFSVAAFAQDVAKSTLDDQTSVEVTVYNSNLGLVKDVRKINLPQNSGELRFMDVAAYIIPETVHIKELEGQGKFMVLEQNYEYDLMDPSKLMDKFVGKKIKLQDYNYYVDRKDVIEAELLSNNNNQPIYKIKGEIHLRNNAAPILPEVPENLIAKPTLMWLYDNGESANTVEVSYLTNNIGWKADYVFVLNKDDTMADLSGWVTIDNKSGTMYKDASLKLVAGEVNRAQQNIYPMSKAMRMDALGGMAAEAPQFVEQGFFEYHIYDLQRPTTLKDNQTKQISLLEAKGINVAKEFLVYGVNSRYNYAYQEKIPKQPVNVNIKFDNKKENNLGMPLPAGIIRLYKEDNEGSLQFIGEDRIEHTPKDEKVTVKVGEAFDIVAEIRQVDYRVITSRIHETEWEVTLKNHKEEDVVVGVIEPVPGDWEVLSNSHPYKKVDAFTLRFDVPVKKDEEVKVNYRIRVTW